MPRTRPSQLWILVSGNAPRRTYAWFGEGAGSRNEASHCEIVRLRKGEVVETHASSDQGATRLLHCVFTGFRL